MPDPLRLVAAGIGFTEGPLYLPNGHVLVTSMSRGQLYEVDLDATGPGAVVGSVETGGGPNGLAIDADGVIWVAQNGGHGFASRSDRPVVSGLQRLEAGELTDIDVPDSVAPNDLVVGPDGAIWFTDPGRDESRGLAPRVRRWDPAAGTVSTVVEDMEFPNGLAFSADGRTLYVADSRTHRIERYAVDGSAAIRTEPLATVEGCGADGIAFDVHGRLYIAAFDLNQIVVLGPDGEIERRVDTGDGSRPTNLCFAGPGLSQLVVTLASGGRVAVVEGDYEGLPL